MGKAAVSQEEIQLRKRARRRMVGAVFLVLVMVIVLPLLLDSEPRPQAESVRVRMPAPQSEVADPPVAPAPKPAAMGPEAATKPAAVAPEAATKPEAGSPESAPAAADRAAPKPESSPSMPRQAPPAMADLPPPVDESAPASKKPVAPAAAPRPAVQQASVQSSATAEPKKSPGSAETVVEDAVKPPVVIQLGAYIKAENAQQLKSELQAKKIKAFTELVTQGATTKTRVRAGPFNSITDAEKARDRIEKMNLKLGMAPKIVPQGQ